MEKDGREMRLYVILEAILFVAIKIAELALPVRPMKIVMYTAIVVNTAAAIWLYRKYGRTARRQWDNLIALALMVNCLADVFLTLIGGEQMFVPGFALFCTLEAIYAIYLKPGRINLAVRAVLFALFLLVARRLDLLTLANALGLLNLSLLSVNVFSAWIARRREKSKASLLFAFALSCFLIGDVSVALEIFTAEGTLFHTIAALAVWTFYVPAQVLIVLTYHERIRPKAVSARS